MAPTTPVLDRGRFLELTPVQVVQARPTGCRTPYQSVQKGKEFVTLRDSKEDYLYRTVLGFTKLFSDR